MHHFSGYTVSSDCLPLCSVPHLSPRRQNETHVSFKSDVDLRTQPINPGTQTIRGGAIGAVHSYTQSMVH